MVVLQLMTPWGPQQRNKESVMPKVNG